MEVNDENLRKLLSGESEDVSEKIRGIAVQLLATTRAEFGQEEVSIMLLAHMRASAVLVGSAVGEIAKTADPNLARAVLRLMEMYFSTNLYHYFKQELSND